MGACGSKSTAAVVLSERLREKLQASFRKIDIDNSGEVDIDEAVKVFKRFSGAAAKKMLKDMDENDDDKISKEEWQSYFVRVLQTGNYTEQDCIEELDEFLDDGAGFSFQVKAEAQTDPSKRKVGSGRHD
ncbi:unnamed protein product [Amoebophrya sp. A25]|nr:unnamed protein product [Amoebophrya sp. A25]|eukprot:GSA25T00004192001.1